VRHGQPLHVFGDEGGGTDPADDLDHASVENRALALRAALRSVDRDVLAGKAADHQIGAARQRADGVRKRAAPDVMPQVQRVGVAGALIGVVRPCNLEGQRFVSPPSEPEAADETEVHAAAAGEQGDDGSPPARRVR